MSDRIGELISGYLDESLSTEEQGELEEWIRESPENARRFARAGMLHDRLQNELGMADVLEGDGVDDGAGIVGFPARQGARMKWMIPLAAAIAILLVVFRDPEARKQDLGEGPSMKAGFVTLAHLGDAEFVGDEAFSAGQRWLAEVMELKSGTVRLQFDSGVEITLQGPARYELVSADRTRLVSGLLTAHVPPGAEGFKVDTPTAEVTDLGTAFGVELDEEGNSRVTVFEGEVEVAEPGSDAPQVLKEGQAVRMRRGQGIETVSFDERPFEKVWPVFSGIESSSGAFQLVPPWRRLRFSSSDDFVFVRPEGYIGELTSPLRVNLSEPGEYRLEEQLTPTSLPAGQEIRSYVLHYQPEQAREGLAVKRMVGDITFDRPVLGVIVLHEELMASAGRFSRFPAGEDQERRELNLNGRLVGDMVRLSPDRRTVHLDLASPRLSSDLVRVIVDAGLPKPPDVL